MAQPRHLLVIDDQRLDRAIASHAGTRAGYDTTGASTIQDVRDLLEQGKRFDFVVLDLSLGLEDGLAALPLLAQFNKSAVVVFASGFDVRVLAASQRLASAVGLRVAGVLQKPLIPSALITLLRPSEHGQIAASDAVTSVGAGQLHDAINEGQIIPWFQPKISLADGTIVGAEALARWIRPDGQVVSPADFIPVAERSGLIAALTDVMLGQAMVACARWRLQCPDCCVAVNISPLLLDDQELTERIGTQLQAHKMPSAALILEITESNGIPNTTRATEILTRLRIRGVQLSMDDFGTGHSSLLSLVQMPFTEMKIDQAFVRQALVSSDSSKVVRASASLGRELGLNVVAEGIETAAMAQFVTEAGCHVGQGWLYGQAVPATVFEAQLQPMDLAPADLGESPEMSFGPVTLAPVRAT